MAARTINRDKSVMRGARLVLPAGVIDRYRIQLQALSDDMTSTTRREVEALFRHPDVEHYFAGRVGLDISPASQARILTNQLKKRFEDLFKHHAKPLADQMVDGADRESAQKLGQSLTQISQGLKLNTNIITGPMREFMIGSIAQNVSLIKSIPQEYMTKVQGAVLRSITAGNGLADLQPFFEDQEGITSRRAATIARDQTHKAYGGLNKGRMEAVGIQEFEWVHSGGGLHPRPYHLDVLNGRVFSFAALPVIDQDTGERGIPGQLINCKCTMTPVIRLTQRGTT